MRYGRFRTASGPPVTRGAGRAGFAAIDREIPRPGENRTRLQAVEMPDRMAEMARIGIADILRQMRQIDVLIGEMQQVPSTLPGPECAERDASLLLEQMQEARRGKSGLRGAACSRHRISAKATDLGDRSDNAWIERTRRQRLAK